MENGLCLFKKPNKPQSNPSNYRPISLISHLSKILEKIITTQIYHWVETNNILNKEQSGFFRKNKSTTDKLFQLTQTISQAKNQRRPSSAIFLDVEKAFDKVWHDGLIHKLLFLNTPLHFLRYINNYISNRSMSFAINNTTSPPSTPPPLPIALNYGVPQGSSISPILFIINVSDLPSPIHDYKVHRSQFADDICDFISAKPTRFIQQQLQNSINQITTYSGVYRIGLNAGKTAQIFFPGKRHTSEKNMKHVTINNTNIPIHNKAKFLGVTFDSSLSFKTHINLTAYKAKHRIMRLHTIYYQ